MNRRQVYQIKWHVQQAALHIARARENSRYQVAFLSWMRGAQWHFTQAGMPLNARVCELAVA
jgi:hypothetical protein